MTSTGRRSCGAQRRAPATTAPRRNPKKRSRLISEHQRRKGDPALGGSTRAPIMTAYRQQALTCAAALAHGPLRPRDLKLVVLEAPKILRGNVYGWFINVERGVYTLTDAGRAALKRWPDYATPAPPPTGAKPRARKPATAAEEMAP